MKHPRDSGASPEARYRMIERKNAIHLTNSDIIRMIADYDKSKHIMKGKIRIQELNEFLFFKITDPEWLHKLNDQWVRVRMFSRESHVIYLFDLKTDTYLTFVNRELETAGDRANATSQDWQRLHDHVQNIENQYAYRQEKLDKVMSNLEDADKNEPTIPDSFKECNEIVFGYERTVHKDKGETDTTSDADELSAPEKANIRKKSKINLPSVESPTHQADEDLAGDCESLPIRQETILDDTRYIESISLEETIVREEDPERILELETI